MSAPELKIVSVEDPVEYFLPWVTHVQVRPAEGVTFGTVIRSLLRSDPDVILVGEIRDTETLILSIQAALTGHLVLTAMHAHDAAGVIKRMQNLKADPLLVADMLRLVISQRLLRRACPECRKTVHLDKAALETARAMAVQGGLDWDSLPKGFVETVGCAKCVQGFKTRTMVAETLEMTPGLEKAVRSGASVDELRALAVQEGMITMAADGIRRAAEGETTVAEVNRVLRLG